MASILPNSMQKRAYMTLVPLQQRSKKTSTISGDNRGLKGVPFGLVPICLGSKTETESRK